VSSVASEPSTVKMSKTSSHNSCLKQSSSAGSHSELITFSRDSLGSPKSFYSSGASDYYSRDDDNASSGVGDKPPDVPEINEVFIALPRGIYRTTRYLSYDEVSVIRRLSSSSLAQLVTWSRRATLCWRGISNDRVRLSVRPSVTSRYCIGGEGHFKWEGKNWGLGGRAPSVV